MFCEKLQKDFFLISIRETLSSNYENMSGASPIVFSYSGIT